MDFVVRRTIDNVGRIVLPKDIRECYGIKAWNILEIRAEKDGIRINLISDENHKNEIN